MEENKEIKQSNSMFDLIRAKTPPEHKSSLYHQVSDESFELMESLCEIIDTGDTENLLGNEEIPEFNNSSEEVNFIIRMSEKIKQQKKSKENVNIDDEIDKMKSSSHINSSTPVASSKSNASLSTKKKTSSNSLSPIFVFPTRNYEVTPQKRIQNQTQFLSISAYKKSQQFLNCNNKSPLVHHSNKF
ncbi:hypothetical protein PVAND_012833 [Polypedilum vanderplanki]|uniref:Uncharacterized protein n=1 Tax=Polypedilum vanderplanki TaxID=319348 RepID=A0A9J6CNM6_POLVA|nr:hypothetical protein PVAND_012833 [Polypedilum vanderplanki]